MKIAILTPTFFPTLGGVQTFVHNLALRLAERGHAVTVVAPFGARRALWLRRLPYRTHTLPPLVFRLYKAGYGTRWAPPLARLYARLQRRGGFDLWQVCYAHPAGTSLVPFARTSGVPYVVRCVGGDLELGGSRGAPPVTAAAAGLRRALATYATMPAFVAISRTVEEALLAEGVSAEAITRIPNGLDVGLFDRTSVDREAVRAGLGIGPGETMVLTVSRNVPSKNLPTILRTAALLRQRGHRGFRFVLVGSGMPRLRAMVPDVLRASVRCLPGFGMDGSGDPPVVPHRGLIALYKAADLFLLPTYHESFGIVFLEAMAAGLPLLGADVPGCRDLVKDGWNGYLPRPDDVATYADRLAGLSADGGVAAAMGARNREQARAYDWDPITERYIRLYERLVDRSTRGEGAT